MNMGPPEIPKLPIREHEIEIRVRYQETDGQGRLHHAQFVNYFEIGRIELFRAAGHSYRDFEASGTLLVVTEIHCEYLQPARYDDLLKVTTRVHRSRGVRIEHHYLINREDQPIARGRSIIACVDRSGKVCRLPRHLQLD